jgi:hypothetical protein
MLIPHSTTHRWTKPVVNDPLADFGQNTTARLRSTLNRIPNFNIKNVVEPLNEAFLDWFLPVYELRINEKANPRVFDIRKKTLGRKKPKQFFSMTLYEGDEKIGGTIFSCNHGNLSVAYRTYQNDWTQANLPANPSSYTEYLINQEAINRDAKTIIHGRDRNPYGLNSSIGLANFKLAAGCHPELSHKYETSTLDTDKLTTDVFVFALPAPNETRISQGFLIVDDIGLNKWSQVAKYGKLLDVAIIKR